MNSGDLRRLLGPVVFVVAAAAVLAATLAYSGHRADAAERDYRRAQRAAETARERYRNAGDDQAVYRRYASRFAQHVAAGWIGPEQRLSWIEALQAINADLRLPTLRYDIGRQETITPGGIALSRRMQLRRTPMVLKIGALHEGDLLAVLARLRDRGAGLMSLTRCRMDRIGKGPAVRFDGRTANLEARCDLAWYTLDIEPESP